jgi:tetratricopeptide (TPR) repeat protein
MSKHPEATMNTRWAMLLLSVGVLLASCTSRKPSTVEAGKADKGAAPEPAEVIFRDAKGRQLTAADLAGFTGKFKWQIVGSGTVPEKAQELHRRGREAGGEGEHHKALELFEQARKEAPQWPYPVYDAAFTYLLKGDNARAEEFYAVVDKMAPRGFFTAKTALDCLRREKTGDLEPGTYKLYVMLEWESDRAKKKATLEQMVKRFPKFPAAWQKLALLQGDDAAKLKMIETGLSHAPDGETRGILLINKALTLNKQGKRDEAIRILGELALDPESTLATEHLAKASLANFVKKP